MIGRNSMLDPLSVASNDQLVAFLEQSGKPFESLGTVLGDFEIWSVQTGGKKDPPIVITAGSHADELGGVYAALKLIRALDCSHRVFVVPVRDPFGFEGFRANIQFALGAQVPIVTNDDVYPILHEMGEVLFRDGTYSLARIGSLIAAFDVGIDFPTSSVGRRLDKIVEEDPSLIAALASATRVVAPWNLPMPRYGDHFQQAARGMIVKQDGQVGNFNRFYDQPDPPKEIEIVRNWVDEVKPGLVLDLHEGYGRGFYVYKAETGTDSPDYAIANEMGLAVRLRGGQTSTPEELMPYWGPELGGDRDYFGNGVFHSGASTTESFGNYCWSFSHSFTLETGGLNPPAWRADLHSWAAMAAIEVWEENQ